MSHSLASAARNLRAARQRLETATETARRAAVWASQTGVTEVKIAHDLGVNRMTVRKWLGKL